MKIDMKKLINLAIIKFKYYFIRSKFTGKYIKNNLIIKEKSRLSLNNTASLEIPVIIPNFYKPINKTVTFHFQKIKPWSVNKSLKYQLIGNIIILKNKNEVKVCYVLLSSLAREVKILNTTKIGLSNLDINKEYDLDDNNIIILGCLRTSCLTGDLFY